MRIAVLGAGKMGLPLACAFASRGADVLACDPNTRLVESVNRGEVPFDEPGLRDLLPTAVTGGKLRATTDNREGIAESDACVIIVPVLLNHRKHADLTIIHSIADEMAEHLRPGSLVSFETTLPVGTTRSLGNRIALGGLQPGLDFHLAFSPERVKSQFVLRHLFAVPKVVGGINPESAARAETLYATYLGAPVINVGSLEAAEMVKLAGMVYRDVNIALANELARYSESVGVDFDGVRAAANTDGEAALLTPGIGVGGHCTPVYPYFLINDAHERGVSTRLAEDAREINEQQPGHMLGRAGPLEGKRVLILGLGFRPGVKEPTCSPAYGLRDETLNRRGLPFLHDPLFSDAELRALGFEPAALEGSEVVVLNTAHHAFAQIDWARLSRAGTRVVIDGRNAWHADSVTRFGIRYIGVGRPEPTIATTPSIGRGEGR